MIAATAAIVPAVGALQPAHAATLPSTANGIVAIPPQRNGAPIGAPLGVLTGGLTGTPAAPVRSAKEAAWIARHKIGLLAVAKAKSKIGKPYVWGATGPNAFDCSGLVQWAYRKAGKKLPRVTYAQYRKLHEHKVTWKNLAAGDLVFFYGKEHVGIVSKRKGRQLWMIHAPHTGSYVQQVKLDRYRKQAFSGAVRPF